MKAIIGRYYKELKDAKRHRETMSKMWKGRIAWYIISYSEGHLVVSETAMRACYPDYDFSYKDRKYD